MYFSRRNETHPLPPSPAFTWIVASSTNMPADHTAAGNETSAGADGMSRRGRASDAAAPSPETRGAGGACQRQRRSGRRLRDGPHLDEHVPAAAGSGAGVDIARPGREVL